MSREQVEVEVEVEPQAEQQIPAFSRTTSGEGGTLPESSCCFF